MTADPAAPQPASPEPASPGALYRAIADAGRLDRFGDQIEAGNPSDWPGYAAQLRQAREAPSTL